jgi:hypothetical protein
VSGKTFFGVVRVDRDQFHPQAFTGRGHHPHEAAVLGQYLAHRLGHVSGRKIDQGRAHGRDEGVRGQVGADGGIV